MKLVLVLILNFFNFNSLMAQTTIANLNQDSISVAANSITRLRHIPIKALDTPVDLKEDFGQYPYFTSGLMGRETETDKWVNAGLARFHTFHYLDAARCFKSAVKSSPKNGIARAFLALSYTQLAGSDSAVLATNELLQVNRLKLSVKERLWVNFIESYIYTKFGNPLNVEVKRVEKTVNDLMTGTDHDPESLTLPIFLVANVEYQWLFEEALSKKSDHVGAHHYLVHFYEAFKNYPLAAQHAKNMADHAKDSAHAQHMYGHILPRLKDWTKAEEQFLKAAKIHDDWSAKYNFPIYYDWHYSHNLDLIGSTYVGLGRAEEALEAFKVSQKYDDRALFAYMKLAVALGRKDILKSKELLKAFENFMSKRGQNPSLAKSYLESYIIESQIASDLKKGSTSSLRQYAEMDLSKTEKVDQIIQELVHISLFKAQQNQKLQEAQNDTEALKKHQLTQNQIDAYMNKFKNIVTTYVEDRVGCASFDGWGKGLLDLMRAWNIAQSLGETLVADEIANILQVELGLDVTKMLSAAE